MEILIQGLFVEVRKLITVITLRFGTDRLLQTMQSQIRRHHTRSMIRVYTVCLTYSNILDTSRGSRMDYFKFKDKYMVST